MLSLIVIFIIVFIVIKHLREQQNDIQQNGVQNDIQIGISNNIQQNPDIYDYPNIIDSTTTEDIYDSEAVKQRALAEYLSTKYNIPLNQIEQMTLEQLYSLSTYLQMKYNNDWSYSQRQVAINEIHNRYYMSAEYLNGLTNDELYDLLYT
jgi:hypothetical protein